MTLTKQKPGYIYLIHFPSTGYDYYKVGRSIKHPKIRLWALKNETGDKAAYIVHYVHVPNISKWESYFVYIWRDFCCDPESFDREWFYLPEREVGRFKHLPAKVDFLPNDPIAIDYLMPYRYDHYGRIIRPRLPDGRYIDEIP